MDTFKVGTPVYQALESGLKNKKLNDKDIDKIEAAIAADGSVDADEAALLDALKSKQAFSLSDGTHTRDVKTSVMLFDEKAVSDFDVGFVRFADGKLVDDTVVLPDAASFKAMYTKDKQSKNAALALVIKAYAQGQHKPAKLLIQALDSPSRLELARWVTDYEVKEKTKIKHRGLARAIMLLAADGPNLRALLQRGKAQDIRVLVKLLEVSDPYLREKLLTVLFTRPSWSHKGAKGKYTDPDAWGKPPDNENYDALQPRFDTQLKLFEAIMKHPHKGLRATGLKQAEILLHTAKLASNETKEDPTGMGMRSYDRRQMDPYRAEFLEEVAKIRADDDRIRVAGLLGNDDHEYAQRAAHLDRYYGNFGDAEASRQYQARIQAAIASGLSSHPAEFVTFMKKLEQEFDHDDLVTSITQLLDPPGKEAARRFYELLTKLTNTIKDTDLRLEKRQEAAYALGKFYGAASVAAKHLPDPGMNLILRLLEMGTSKLPGVKEVPGSIKAKAIDWIDANFTEEGKIRGQQKATRAEVQAQMDEAQEELMAIDGSGSEFEAQFLTGRSYYEKPEYR